MKRLSIISYFNFGTCVRFLQDVRTGYKIKGSRHILRNLDRFLATIGELDLQVTGRTDAFLDLTAFKKELEEIKDRDAELSAEQSSELKELMNDVRKTLEAEMEGYEAFVVTPKIMDVNKLLDNAASLLAPNVFSNLPTITQYDLEEAGKCIAFERPTAAAFHVLRGVEAMLRLFYCNLVLRNRVSPLMWGDMVNDLRTRRKTKRHTMLYNNLDNIRFSYRNPTQHPEMTYDIHEVQDLWPLCIEVINRMVRILRET